MMVKRIVAGLLIAALILLPILALTVPADGAGGSDSPVPYTVDIYGITLPEGAVFRDSNHVNLRTSQGSKSVHMEAKCINRQDAECGQDNRYENAQFIGKNFIPWTAFGLVPEFCVEWIQIDGFNEHYGEGGQPPICTTPGEPEEPPTTQPPVDPPTTNPPVTEPPVTEPPVTEPPVTQPPTTEPPVTTPPTDTPSVPVDTPSVPTDTPSTPPAVPSEPPTNVGPPVVTTIPSTPTRAPRAGEDRLPNTGMNGMLVALGVVGLVALTAGGSALASRKR